MIFIELVIDASPGAREALAELARRTARGSQQEKGCVLYRFSTDVELPDRFALTEMWEDEDALKAHFAGQTFRSFFAELPSEVTFVGNRAWEGPLSSYTPPDPGLRW